MELKERNAYENLFKIQYRDGSGACCRRSRYSAVRRPLLLHEGAGGG